MSKKIIGVYPLFNTGGICVHAIDYAEVPCAVVDIDKTREKALNIALNKITGAWDDSLLA